MLWHKGKEQAPNLGSDCGTSCAGIAALVRAPALFLSCVLLLSACQVRPLYLSAGSSIPITADLTAIDVEIDSQAEVAQQALLNALVFALRDGASLSEERYKLSILLTKRSQRVAVEEFQEVPNAYFVELVASFTLLDNTTRRTLLTGQSFSNSSYDFSTQRFANIRAERDADQRAAAVIAKDIQVRLAAYFAKNPGLAAPSDP